MGVEIVLNRGRRSDNRLTRQSRICTFTGQTRNLACDAVVMVSSRIERNEVYASLKAREADWSDAGIKSVTVIGDAEAPGPIAWATYAGHRYARELDGKDIGDALPFRREITQLAEH